MLPSCGGPIAERLGFAAVQFYRPTVLSRSMKKPFSSRLDKSAHGRVVQINLTSVGVNRLGSYPEKFARPPEVPELFFNGQRMTVARWPNDDWAKIAKIVECGSIPRKGDSSGRAGVFEYHGDRPARWDVSKGVWLSGYWCFDWYNETIKVSGVDKDRRRIILARPSHYGIRQGNPSPRRYYAVNLLEELDSPGEYYIDNAKKKLYFWPAVRNAKCPHIAIHTQRAVGCVS